MTVKQGKRLTWLLAALVFAAIVLDVVSYVLRPDRFRLTDAAMPLLLLMMFFTLRRHYAQLEAAHGPDYEMTVKGGRWWILALGLLVAVGVGATAYLLANR